MQGLEGKSAITGISALKWINTIWNTLVQNANISHSLSARRGLIMGLRETGDEPLFLMKQTHCLETNHMLALNPQVFHISNVFKNKPPIRFCICLLACLFTEHILHYQASVTSSTAQ